MRRLLAGLYGALLFCYPPSLRREHGADMRQLARTAMAQDGLAAAPRLFLDLCASVPREWALLLKGFSMTGLGRDVSYALRTLRRSPGFSVAAIVTLALGIGANTAIFSLADATLLHTVRVHAPEQLYTFKWSASYPDYLQYAERSDLFSGVMATAGGPRMNVTIDGVSELTNAAFVSGNYFGVLGVPASAGRVLTAADDVRNGPIAAVLGYQWWRSRFGLDRSIVGRTIHLNAVPVTIVGVAAADFRGTSLFAPPQLFLPLNAVHRVRTGFLSRLAIYDSADTVWLSVTGRLRPTVSVANATGAINAMYARLHPPPPGADREDNELTPLRIRAMGGRADDVHRFIVLLVTVVGLTLLIGCANLANLMLARSAARRRDIAVRMAMGAGRARVARQVLGESLVLAAAGGLAGLYVASITLKLIARFQLPGGIDIEHLRLGISPWALAFTAAVSLLTGLLFGIAPALRAGKADVMHTLRDDARAASARSRLRSSLVAAQVALSLVLLTGTGLFLRSLANTLDAPLGYRVDGVAAASVNLGIARFDAARARTFYDTALTRVRQLPGVSGAAWTNVVPVNGIRMFDLQIDGYAKQGPQDSTTFYNAAVGPDYFATMGTRLVKGRTFSGADTAAAPHVAIVNETAVRRFWQGRDPLDGRLRLTLRAGGSDDFQVVGVVADTVIRELGERPAPYVYVPFAQADAGGTLDAAHLFVRVTGDPGDVLPQLRAQLLGVDPTAPVYDVTTFAWHLRQLLMPQRMGATLFGIFSVLALSLAAVGIYGVASYVAALRTREMGIRIALGADALQIRSLVLRGGATPIVGGLVAGLVLAALASRLAAAFLRGVSPRDPLTYAAVAMLLATIAFVATWLPARRAARLDPVAALRQE